MFLALYWRRVHKVGQLAKWTEAYRHDRKRVVFGKHLLNLQVAILMVLVLDFLLLFCDTFSLITLVINLS